MSIWGCHVFLLLLSTLNHDHVFVVVPFCRKIPSVPLENSGHNSPLGGDVGTVEHSIEGLAHLNIMQSVLVSSVINDQLKPFFSLPVF